MRIDYRPEIDGLRAISVVLVILYHLDFEYFPGGFVGVDIFFVISGFLITSLVSREISSGEFSILEFYKRRVIRLAPAFFLVILITSIVSFHLMLPGEFVNYLDSVVFSSIFLSNLYLWDQVGGYFAVNSDTIPLLHLWSLAVEEQFYLVWPIFLLITVKLFRNVFYPVLVLVVLGLVFSEWSAINYKAAAYYLAPTRAFELLMGALLAFLPKLTLSSRLNNALSLAGLLIVLYTSTQYSDKIFFPGLNAFAVCLGACLMLVFAQGENNVLSRLLSSQLFCFAGKISYPAYLIHWPIISFLHLYHVALGPLVALSVFVLTFVLAAFTYVFVERPFQKMRTVNAKSVIGFSFVLPALILCIFAFYGKENKAWPDRVSPELLLKNNATLSRSREVRGRCNQGRVLAPLPAEKCVLGEGKAKLSVLLVGDSHGNHFTGFIDVLLKDANRRGYDITQSRTAFLPDIRKYQVIAEKVREYENFFDRNKFLVEHIKSSNYEFVVMGGAFAFYMETGVWDPSFDQLSNQKVFSQSLRRAIEIVIAQSSIPVIIEGNPQFKESLADCTLNNMRFDLGNDCGSPRAVHDRNFSDWSDFLSTMEATYPSLVVIRITDLICDELICQSELNGIPLYIDAAHLNYMGSKHLGEEYLKVNVNPFNLGTYRVFKGPILTHARQLGSSFRL